MRRRASGALPRARVRGPGRPRATPERRHRPTPPSRFETTLRSPPIDAATATAASRARRLASVSRISPPTARLNPPIATGTESPERGRTWTKPSAGAATSKAGRPKASSPRLVRSKSAASSPSDPAPGSRPRHVLSRITARGKCSRNGSRSLQPARVQAFEARPVGVGTEDGVQREHLHLGRLPAAVDPPQDPPPADDRGEPLGRCGDVARARSQPGLLELAGEPGFRLGPGRVASRRRLVAESHALERFVPDPFGDVGRQPARLFEVVRRSVPAARRSVTVSTPETRSK